VAHDIESKKKLGLHGDGHMHGCELEAKVISHPI